jgi:hypothetical protein
MDIPPSIQLDRARRRRKRRSVVSPPTPPPVTPDQIVSVAFGPGSNQFTATLSSALVAVENPAQGMWALFVGPDPLLAQTADVSGDGMSVVFTFESSLDGSVGWHVEDAGMWEWLDGGPMNPPYDGPFDGSIS